MISEALNRFWVVDENASVQLIRDCRAVRPDAAADEIAFFVREKVALARSNRNIQNPTGFVLATVPQCFAGVTFEDFRVRWAESKRLAEEEAEWKRREAESMNAWLRKNLEATVANPNISDEKRREAQAELEREVARMTKGGEG